MARREHWHRCLTCGEAWTCEEPWCKTTSEDECSACQQALLEALEEPDEEEPDEEDADAR